MPENIDAEFRERVWEPLDERTNDQRNEYARDKARVIHSAAFRRLQGKTQVMGVGEGDFHRTRLTHSIEVGQIAEGLVERLRQDSDGELLDWLPPDDLVIAASYSHDLGHPPFGHGGESALHSKMVGWGQCFEGNGQTLRIMTRLEKYSAHQGSNPTRRLVLGVLKYPVPYSSFDVHAHKARPPKCFYDSENEIVEWALAPPFSDGEKARLMTEKSETGKALHRTLDCSIVELADDIAYGVHDLEDIVARGFVDWKDLEEKLVDLSDGQTIGQGNNAVGADDFRQYLFQEPSWRRKGFISQLVNLFVTSVRAVEVPGFQHPLLRYKAELPDEERNLLESLAGTTKDLVIRRAPVRQLERRGQRIVGALVDELIKAPGELVPHASWVSFDAADSEARRVRDYVAGMTDSYAERVYNRLFTPSFGSSRDEL